eukprot:6195012-Pleurochrysis_carterae.AAC.1
MFCPVSARRPDALKVRKLEPRADKSIHLGTLPHKPGYRLEVLERPRKGKLITTMHASGVLPRDGVPAAR